MGFIKDLVGQVKTEVILFGAVSAGQHVRTLGGLDFILYPEEVLEQLKAEAKEYLEGVKKRLSGGKGEIKIALKVGDVAQEILRAATRRSIGIIAMSAHGHSGIEKWVFGSTASKVLENSNRPVLFVKVTGAKG